jgi:hypothetical protein
VPTQKRDACSEKARARISFFFLAIVRAKKKKAFAIAAALSDPRLTHLV